MRRRAELLLALAVTALTAAAQTVKSIGVGQGAPYTDHVALLEDSRDMDLMVKFVFDEAENKLTVSLISYRSLFVFREDTRYKMAVKCRRLRPERFPYLVETAEGSKFKLTKDFRHGIPKKRKKYIFKRWVEYEGLQPAPMEYKMVNDYIEQTFDIVGKRDFVTLTLRDIIVMDRQQTKPNKPERYQLFFRRDLNTRYQIQLLRNPCFGLDAEVAAAVAARDAIAKAYATFKKQFGRGYVSSEESLAMFREMKGLLIKQYVPLDTASACPDIRQARQAYNLYIDSISRVNCMLREETPTLIYADGSDKPANDFDVQNVLSNARQIDNMVSRWVVAGDAVERHDLVRRCQDLIDKTSAQIGKGRPQTKEQQNAVDLFRSAVDYFKKTCSVALEKK